VLTPEKGSGTRKRFWHQKKVLAPEKGSGTRKVLTPEKAHCWWLMIPP
jgi:hypothetical protein